MTPAARVQAAIDLLDAIIASVARGGAAADTLIAGYFRERRYAGSKDRRAVRDLVYRAIRAFAEAPPSGRAAMVGLASTDAMLGALFDGSPHGPAQIAEDEERAVPAERSLPRWMFAHLPSWFDDREQAALLNRAPLHVRVNGLRASRAEVQEQYAGAVPIAGTRFGLALPEGTAVDRGPASDEGLVAVQDAGSQIIAAACHAMPGQTVVDLCAGAGGKTLALAADMAGEGILVAADVNRARLDRLRPRAERAGASFIEARLLDGGREAATLADLAGRCDCVLVDAPCTGMGTWRRNPEARWRLDAAMIDRMTALQAHVLDLAAPLVRPGGALVYAVCSLLEPEGPAQIDAFLARHAGWVTPPQDDAGRPAGYGRILTPAHDGTDGFFFARLQKA